MSVVTGDGMRQSKRRRGQVLASVAGVVGAVMATSPVAVSFAQEMPAASQLVQATERRSFNIPPQSLQSALVLFGQQSGRQVGADTALLAGLSTQGVQGMMTVEEALQRLLASTGLTYSIVNGTTIALQRAGRSGQLAPGILQLDPVQVQGVFPVPPQAMIDNIPPPYAGGQVATGGQLGLLGNRDVMDTPFNQTSYTARKVQDQQARTVREALVDDPSVQFLIPEGGVGSNLIYIRGFSVNPINAAFGGLYGLLPSYSIVPEFAERIEVLKGPSAMLNGMPPATSIGGTLNIVPKRASEEPLTQITANYASDAQFGVHADLGRRFGSERQFGVRFNGVFRGGQTGVQWNTNQQFLAALGLDYRGERVRLSSDLGYQYQFIGGVLPYIGLANGIPLPWAPDARKNVGQPWSNKATKDIFGVLRGEVDLTERITAYAAFGAHDSRYSQLYGTDILSVTGFNGAGTGRPAVQIQYNSFLTGEAGIRALVDTGPIGHEFAVTGMALEQNSGIATVTGTVYATNLYNPTVIAPPSIPTPAANKTGTTYQSSLGFADTMSLADKRIQLTVGGRLQRVSAQNFNVITGAQTTNYDQSAFTPSAALVFKPWQNVSLYGNFIQGLQQGTIVGSQYANAGEVFPPYKSTQFEVGVKVDWGKLTTTASLFQITQPSTIVDATTNTLTLNGEQRNQGLELNFFGEPVEGVRVLGGAMFLDAVLAKTAGGLTDGWTAPVTPSFQLRLSGEWDTPFVRGLTLSGRVAYTGAQYLDTTYPRRSQPAWTRLDLGARYTLENSRSPTGKPLVVRFNVENVLDANYWADAAGVTTLAMAPPRTFRLAVTTDF